MIARCPVTANSQPTRQPGLQLCVNF